jgi:enoyl-CoA hydratase/carnithine racemase
VADDRREDSSPTGPFVRTSVDGPIATITLDSPHNRNALSTRLQAELSEELVSAAVDDAVRVVVLTHSGGTFCAGADLSEAVSVGMEAGARTMLALLRQIAVHPKPVVAAVRGHVRAGGLGLVGACDVALVTDDSTFAFTESLLGLTPAVISLTTLTRLSERDAALKFLAGTRFDGIEAARSGLATRSVAAEAFDAVLATVVDDLTQASPQGLRETKALLNRSLLDRIDRDGGDLAALSARLFGSDEGREGMLAFRERREPAWRSVKP